MVKSRNRVQRKSSKPNSLSRTSYIIALKTLEWLEHLKQHRKSLPSRNYLRTNLDKNPLDPEGERDWEGADIDSRTFNSVLEILKSNNYIKIEKDSILFSGKDDISITDLGSKQLTSLKIRKFIEIFKQFNV